MKRVFKGSVFLLVLFYSTSVFAGMPLSTDDSGTIAPYHLQVEWGMDYLKESSGEKEMGMCVALTTGLFCDNFDFAMGIPYSWLTSNECDDSDGVGDIEGRLKYRFAQESFSTPSLAVTLGFKLDNADEENGLGSGTEDFNFNFIVEKTIQEITIYGNLGYNDIGNISDSDEETIDFVNLSLAGKLTVTDTIHFLAEVCSELATENTCEDDPVELLMGQTYTLSCETVLSCGIAFGLTDSSPDLRISFGMTHEF